ncbi:MAG: UDP-2,3-diacylglucosamine diphosphatase [Burkholderiales bacterium]
MREGGDQDVRPSDARVRPILLASDLHLSSARPQIAEAFVGFLEHTAAESQALYLLGDLFDLWVGDDDPDPLNLAVLDALGRLTARNVPVYLMHGNRDFLFGEAGARRAGVRLVDDPTRVRFFGTQTLLMHGDTLCTDDAEYLEQRARYRRPWVLRGFLALPRFLRVGVGQYFRRKSERAKRVTPREIMDVNPQAVADTLRANGYPRLIHGHTHRPARHEHVVDGRVCERWVLGDWYSHGSYLRVMPAGIESVLLP